MGWTGCARKRHHFHVSCLGESAFIGFPSVLFIHRFRERTLGMSGGGFLQAVHHPITNNVELLKDAGKMSLQLYFKNQLRVCSGCNGVSNSGSLDDLE